MIFETPPPLSLSLSLLPDGDGDVGDLQHEDKEESEGSDDEVDRELPGAVFSTQSLTG